MKQTAPEDLRIRKTKSAIRRTIKEMICEMEYDQITIKELTARAQINRKTFYLHYQDLNHLFAELQEELAEVFTNKDISFYSISDLNYIIRLCFESAIHMPLYYERLMCHDSYRFIGDQISERVIDYRKQSNRGIFCPDEYAENLIFAYWGATWKLLYRQWVADGKKLSLDELVTVATSLICRGISDFIKL